MKKAFKLLLLITFSILFISATINLGIEYLHEKELKELQKRELRLKIELLKIEIRNLDKNNFNQQFNEGKIAAYKNCLKVIKSIQKSHSVVKVKSNRKN